MFLEPVVLAARIYDILEKGSVRDVIKDVPVLFPDLVEQVFSFIAGRGQLKKPRKQILKNASGRLPNVS
jgi:hypothetical protein